MGKTRWAGSWVAVALAGAAPVIGQEVGPSGSTQVLTVADSMVGAVGGVAVDGLGTIYVADFRETVFKVQPDGRVAVHATGLYGASGNTVGPHGELYQASFTGGYVSRIDRDGSHEIIADGLQGPVGVARAPDGTLYVNNCSGNTVSRIAADGTVSEFARSDLLNCPNGITRHPSGELYVVNFSDGNMLRVDTTGAVSRFASLPGGGLGHVAFMRGKFYVTAFQSHRVYEVTTDGEVELLAGTGAIGEVDGAGDEASFSWPNGIAAGPTGDRLYVNDFLNRFPPTILRPPVPQWSLRMIKLASISQLMASALGSGGLAAMESAYRNFKDDPSTANVFTELEVNAFGYRLLGSGQIEAATRVFELNVESYPASFNVYDSLAEAYMNAGENAKAIEFYEKSLAINPGNTNAVEMIDRIRGGG